MKTETKNLYCRRKCHAWTRHRVYPYSQKVLCLSCGDERQVSVGELVELISEAKGGPEKRI